MIGSVEPLKAAPPQQEFTGPQHDVQETLARAQSEGAVVLDVREDDEWAAGHAPDATHIPLGELPQRLVELDQNAHYAVHCRSGARSAKAVKLMQDAGFGDVRNVKGGILAWSDEVDPSIPKY